MAINKGDSGCRELVLFDWPGLGAVGWLAGFGRADWPWVLKKSEQSSEGEERQQQDGRVKWAGSGWISSGEGGRSSTCSRGRSVDTPLTHSSQGTEIVYIPPGEVQDD